MMISRRHAIAGALAVPGLLFPLRALAGGRIEDALKQLEMTGGGKLGVSIYDYNGRRWYGRHENERFALCSTHKCITAAHVLSRVDRGEETLARTVAIRSEDIQSYAPVAKKHEGGTLTIAELCEASMIWSDNTAANLLFDSVGGPGKVTAFVRSLGDRTTNLDRYEPEMNRVEPGDPRDTSTPLAMTKLLMKLSLGNVLSPASREQFNRWLIGNKTGDKRLRGGAPAGWIAGDKTGSGFKKEINDIGVFWPPQRKPIVISAYYADGNGETADDRGAVLIEVGRLAASL